MYEPYSVGPAGPTGTVIWSFGTGVVRPDAGTDGERVASSIHPRLEANDYARALHRGIGRRLKCIREDLRDAARDRHRGPTRGMPSNWGFDPENLNQHNVSEKLGRTQTWLAKLENAVTGISVADVLQLAESYETTPAEILRPLTREEQKAMEEELSDLRRRRSKPV